MANKSTFPIKAIAKEWAARFGGTDGCEEKAFTAGAAAALDYAIRQTFTGATPAMIRHYLREKLEEIKP